jgi:hypothetical protein
MRVLTPVVEIPTLTLLHARQSLTLRRAIALQFIGDDHSGDILPTLAERAEALLRGLFVTPALHEDIEDMVVLIHHSL